MMEMTNSGSASACNRRSKRTVPHLGVQTLAAKQQYSKYSNASVYMGVPQALK